MLTDLTAERWKKIENLFERGLDLAFGEREALLAQEAADDPAIAKQVRVLWQNADAPPSFLDRPLAELPFVEQEHRQVFERGHQVAGRFTILELLGAGGMGEVYRARDERLGRTVALKVLSSHIANREGYRQRLEREARAISALGHPRICALHDVGSDRDIPYLVMEFLAGEPLSGRLLRGPLSVPDLMSFASQILEALACAHGAGVIHRDLKPANVMLTDSGVKLLDFGIAKRTADTSLIGDDPPSSTNEGQVIGTIAYMSPEQAEGRPVDARSDIFSFGSMLYEMATGQRAFQGSSSISTLAAILREEPQPVRKLQPASPPALDALIRKCLRKNPAERPQTAAEVRRRLEQIREGAVRNTSLWRVALVVIGLTVVAGAGALFWTNTHQRSTPSRPIAPVRLTGEAGNARNPALSPDGKLLAWTSDRAGNFDIYLKQIGTEAELRLTSGSHNETSPAFTPDGKYLVFHSDEESAGLQVIPALGGTRRILAGEGFRPRVSPDGAHVLYYTTPVDDPYALIPGSGIWRVPLAGGKPHRLYPELTTAALPIWLDERHILLEGYRNSREAETGRWYLGSIDEDALSEIDIMPALRSLGVIKGWARPLFAIDRRVFFRVVIDDVDSLVSLPFDPRKPAAPQSASRVLDSLNRLNDVSASAAGSFAFAVTNENHDVYRLRFDRKTHMSVGAAERLTFEPGNEDYGAVSADGRLLAFLSDRGESRALWLKDLSSGRARRIAATPNVLMPIDISPDGKQIAFFDLQHKLTIAPAAGGPAITAGPGYGHAWWISPNQLAAARVTPNYARVQQVQMSVPDLRVIWEGSWWPLNSYCSSAKKLQWCFTLNGKEIRLKTRPLGASPEQEKVIATLPSSSAFHFHGDREDVLYWHGREGSKDVVFARRVDPHTGAPSGEAFVAHRFDGQVRVAPAGHHSREMRNGAFVFTMSNSTGNIWLQTLPDRD